MFRSKRASLLLTLGIISGLTAPTRSAAQDGEPKQTVLLTNIEFRPNRIQVKAGDRIRFINKDKFDHDVYLVRTANRNDVMLPATTLHPGQSTIVTIDQDGLFTLYCTIHGGMTGKITTTDTFELTEEEKKRAAARKVIPPIVKVGEEIYWGRGQCHHCHMMGERGTHLRGPNHQDLGFRAAARAAKFGMKSATEYIVQSIMEPSAHIVEGYSDDMPKVYQPPISLTEEDIKALVAYLQSQGGEVDTWSISINQQLLAEKLPDSPFRNGDPRRGAGVFHDMACGSCHTVGDQVSISPAPELTAIGAYRNWTWLSQSIIDPNAEIGANWRDAIVYLKPGVFLEDDEEEEEEEDDEAAYETDTPVVEPAPDPVDEALSAAHAEMEQIRQRIATLEQQRASAAGPQSDATGAELQSSETPRSNQQIEPEPERLPDDDVDYGGTVRGVIRKNTAEEVAILVTPDHLQTFPGDQVARVAMSELSRMASNYGELLTFQQVADLVRYLESLKGPPNALSAGTR